MATAAQRPKLLVIVGATASGKSALALKIAKELNGEIISADSRTIYQGLDIGTAKPSPKEQERIPHWGIDLVRPDETYNVAKFKNYAKARISEIQQRGKLPILVGGSGLYVDSVLFDYQFSPPGSERDTQNPRHLKKDNKASAKRKIRPNTLVIGLRIPKEKLKERITQRVDKMVQDGFTEEVKEVGMSYGWDSNALLTPGYKAFRDYIKGGIGLEEAKAAFIQNDLNLAKRQRTWFKRNRDIKWFNNAGKAYKYVKEQLTEHTKLV